MLVGGLGLLRWDGKLVTQDGITISVIPFSLPKSMDAIYLSRLGCEVGPSSY